MLPVIAVLLSAVTAFSASAASFDIGSMFGSDPIRSFFTILNVLTTKDDSPSYTETPLEQVEYTEAELARRQAIVDLVNKDLNRIKTEKPGFSVNSQKGRSISSSILLRFGINVYTDDHHWRWRGHRLRQNYCC